MKKYLLILYLCLSSSIYGSHFSPQFYGMTSKEVALAKDYYNAITTPHLQENPKKRWEAAIKLAKGYELDEIATELMWEVDRDGTWKDKIRIKIWYKIRAHAYLLLKLVGATLTILVVWLAIRWSKSNKSSNILTDINDRKKYNKAEKSKQDGLIYAAKKGYLRVVQHYIKNENKDINILSKTNRKTALHYACEHGHLDVATYLVNAGADQYIKDKYGNNALHYACFFSGSVPMVNWLLDVCKIDIETKGFKQRTPFLCAARKGRLEIAKLLKQRGANLHATDAYKNNALHAACKSSNSEEMVKLLLDVCNIDLETKGFEQRTPFLFAAEGGRLGIAKLLKQRGANIKVKDEYKNNALHLACLFSRSEEMVTWLLGKECKIDIETQGFEQRTPFLCAAREGHLAIAKLLRQRGANINAKNEKEYNALHYACLFSGSVKMVTWLLDVCKIDIETKGFEQRTPFLCAAEGGHLGIAKLLKQRGANIHAKDKDSDNALHYACLFSGSVPMVNWLLDVCKIDIETKGYEQRMPFLCAAEGGHLEIAKLLKQRGANINAINDDKNNALHLACLYSSSVKMVTWLLDVCKIDIESKGYEQRMPFLCAAEGGHLGIAELLKQRGANINAINDDKNNALHLACLYSSSVKMVTWLLDVCKIDIETKGYEQRTPFLCAAEEGQLEIAKLLKQRGANINAKDKDSDNALHYACLFSGSVDMVTWLLDVCHIGIETKGYEQRTPFLSAANKGQLAIAKLLRQRGANINAKNEKENNALHLACLHSGSVDMVTWLLDVCKLGIKTKGFEQKTPFLCAAKGGQLAIAKLLKQRGANINAKNEKENNALHLACLHSGSVDMVTWLLDVCHIGIETKGYEQRTPFLSAANKGQLAIAKLLRQRGANINAKNEKENNALHLACLHSGSVDMVTWLLDVCKLGIKTKGFEQKTPFLCAAKGGQLAIAKLLKQRGADINATGTNNKGALQLATEGKHQKMIDYLTSLKNDKT